LLKLQKGNAVTDISDLVLEEYEEVEEDVVLPELIGDAKRKIIERCASSPVKFSEEIDEDGDTSYTFTFKSGRGERTIKTWSAEKLLEFPSLPFENYSFLSDLEAICSYKEGVIEIGLKLAGQLSSMGHVYSKLFGMARFTYEDFAKAKLTITSETDPTVALEISESSPLFRLLTQSMSRTMLTLKVTGVQIKQHDLTVELVRKLSGSLLFQLDMLAGVPFILRKPRKPVSRRRHGHVVGGVQSLLQFPTSEFDNAPLSLYWYGRSAEDMPLLQYLAFYQVIEFYFPVYSQTEAHRKLKLILKNPTFRGDRDADIARLLSAIHVSRSGAFGDERSQLRATISECVDNSAVREFIETDTFLNDFFTVSGKTLPFHKIPLANKALDLRSDIAERIYDIRCKIVHTKADIRDVGGELILPFSKEAESMTADIKLIQHIAQVVLIAGSRSLHI
jgi:hypothetical protein